MAETKINVGAPTKAFCILSGGQLVYAYPTEKLLPTLLTGKPLVDIFHPDLGEIVYQIYPEHLGQILSLLKITTPVDEEYISYAETLTGKGDGTLRTAVLSMETLDWETPDIGIKKDDVTKHPEPRHVFFFELCNMYLTSLLKPLLPLLTPVFGLATSCWFENNFPMEMAAAIGQPLFVHQHGVGWGLFTGYIYTSSLVYSAEDVINLLKCGSDMETVMSGASVAEYKGGKLCPTSRDIYTRMKVVAGDDAKVIVVIDALNRLLSSNQMMGALQSAFFSGLATMGQLSDTVLGNVKELATMTPDEIIEAFVKAGKKNIAPENTVLDMVSASMQYATTKNNMKYGKVPLGANLDDRKTAFGVQFLTFFEMVSTKSCCGLLINTSDEEEALKTVSNICAGGKLVGRLKQDFQFYGLFHKWNRLEFTEFANLSAKEGAVGIRDFSSDKTKVKVSLKFAMTYEPLLWEGAALITRQIVLAQMSNWLLGTSNGFKTSVSAVVNATDPKIRTTATKRMLTEVGNNLSLVKGFVKLAITPDNNADLNTHKLVFNPVQVLGNMFSNSGNEVLTMKKLNNPGFIENSSVAMTNRGVIEIKESVGTPVQMLRELILGSEKIKLCQIRFMNENNLETLRNVIVASPARYNMMSMFTSVKMQCHVGTTEGAVFYSTKLNSHYGQQDFMVRITLGTWSDEIRGSGPAVSKPKVYGTIVVAEAVNKIISNCVGLKKRVHVSAINFTYPTLDKSTYTSIITLLKEASYEIIEDEPPGHEQQDDGGDGEADISSRKRSHEEEDDEEAVKIKSFKNALMSFGDDDEA